MKSFFSYLKNVREEMNHVVWPKPRVTVGHTILIIILSAFTAVVLAAFDYIFTGLVSSFLV